ncbi:hypothetical protein GSI_02510 [Ganoderma sinense ZZ0214-1]|uniref:Uncharacterized protein n=1 Tax=Ganoderma sinense ZZ0214-1 TaxID=1077348 RepID=A0A2G8SPV7_9APHY|nr:hypothetical protein GSI_02510 [Ganoderma sinense ZZ0214-1]
MVLLGVCGIDRRDNLVEVGGEQDPICERVVLSRDMSYGEPGSGRQEEGGVDKREDTGVVMLPALESFGGESHGVTGEVDSGDENGSCSWTGWVTFGGSVEMTTSGLRAGSLITSRFESSLDVSCRRGSSRDEGGVGSVDPGFRAVPEVGFLPFSFFCIVFEGGETGESGGLPVFRFFVGLGCPSLSASFSECVCSFLFFPFFCGDVMSGCILVSSPSPSCSRSSANLAFSAAASSLFRFRSLAASFACSSFSSSSCTILANDCASPRIHTSNTPSHSLVGTGKSKFR